jgi:hypothetical protein
LRSRHCCLISLLLAWPLLAAAQMAAAKAGAVRWTNGVWAERFTLAHEVVAPETARTRALHVG